MLAPLQLLCPPTTSLPAPISYYTLRVETVNGKPVSEGQIQAWAGEAEQGYDPQVLRQRGRKPVGDGPGRVIPVRLDDTILSALDSRAEHDHTSRSEAIRAAIRAYLG